MIQPVTDGVLIDVRVVPRAGRSGIAGERDGAMLIRLSSPPVEGTANEELVEVLARTFGVPKRAVTIVSGDRSRRKRVKIVGINADTVKLMADG